MKEMTEAFANAAAQDFYQPVVLLQIGMPGRVLSYSDSASAPVAGAEARVLDWGRIDSCFEHDKSMPERVRVRLSDHDGALREILIEEGLGGREATVSLCFAGLSEQDMLPLAGGKTGKNPIWSEKDNSVIMDIEDISASFANRSVGVVASRENFSKIRPKDAGKILPIVYGKAERVRALLVESGAETTLARKLYPGENSLYVADARDFPAGEIRLRIGLEEISGTFDGNTFNISQRAMQITSGTTAEDAGSLFTVQADSLKGVEDNFYTGYSLKINLSGRDQYRFISHSVGQTGVLVFQHPFWLDDGNPGPVPGGSAFSITTIEGTHDSGSRVMEVLDEYVFIASAQESSAVEKVEGWGIAQPGFAVGRETIIREEQGYAELPGPFYKVNLSDNRYLQPAGRAVTTICMKRLPRSVPQQKFLSHELYVTLRGPVDTAGLIETPAKIIRHFLENFCQLQPAEINSTSFDAAESARSNYRFGFALEKRGKAVSIAADMALQACLSLTWRDNRARLEILENRLPTPLAELSGDNIEADSLEIGKIPDNEVIGEILACWGGRGSNEIITVADVSAGLDSRTSELDLWAVRDRATARSVSEFWLRRLKHAYTELSLSAILGKIALESGDIVSISKPGFFASGQKGRIVGAGRLPGNIAGGESGRVKVKIRLPIWEGCTSTCEVACESGTCETSSCEMSCTVGLEVGCSWKCETFCEQACELSCTATCEVACQATCMVFARVPGETYDCTSSCETGCEVSCEGFACETTNETGCTSNCQAAASETVCPVRAVKMTQPPTSQSGAATVVQVDKNGSEFGSNFSAQDSLDSHPANGELSAVLLNHNLQWILLQNSRSAKYVKIVSDNGGGSYSVQEQDHSGNTWGGTFTAYEP